MKLPPSAIVYDDGETIYIRQDRVGNGVSVVTEKKRGRPENNRYIDPGRLKWLMKERALTHERLAEMLTVTSSTTKRITKDGKTNPGLIRELARVFDMNPVDLCPDLCPSELMQSPFRGDAFLHLQHQSGRVAFLSAQLELITTSMRDNLDRIDSSTHTSCLYELANAARQIGRELHSEFVDYRNHWKEEGESTHGN
jgi:hypothetical protein